MLIIFSIQRAKIQQKNGVCKYFYVKIKIQAHISCFLVRLFFLRGSEMEKNEGSSSQAKVSQ